MVKEKPHKYLKDLEDMNLNELTCLAKARIQLMWSMEMIGKSEALKYIVCRPEDVPLWTLKRMLVKNAAKKISKIFKVNSKGTCKLEGDQ